MTRSPRAWAASLLAAGILLGTVTDTVAPRTPPRAGEYWILAGDFHVHTFPGDGWLTPSEVVREAHRAGLDVVAITSHNETWPARLGRWLAPADGPLVLVGQEITNPGYHLIGAGIARTVNWWQPVAGAIVEAQSQGGVAIAAHPSRRFWDEYDDVARARLDGVETVDGDGQATPRMRRDIAAFFADSRRQNPTLAPIASSDFHARRQHALGLVRTYLFVRERSEAGVLEAIRSGRTVAVDADGALHGDAALVRQAELHRPAGRVSEHDGWRHVSIALAWLGILGLAALRPRRAGAAS